MQRAAGEIRGEEPGDAGLALKAENFTNGCAAAERDSSQPRSFWAWFFFAEDFFLLPLLFPIFCALIGILVRCKKS